MRRTCWLGCLPLLSLSLLGSGAGDAPRVSAAWLDRLDAEDRTCLERHIGCAPPAFPRDAVWPVGAPQTWDALRGRVVVLQGWTCKTTPGRSWPQRTAELLDEFGDDVVVIAVHTPQGADKAKSFLARRDLEMPVMIDPGGYFCDALGLYERPVNVVVDRNGFVRYAGLNRKGLREAVTALVAEPHDPEARPEPPDPAGKVVVIDFWAVWCPPCRGSIPHMNDLADSFRDEVVCIGISSESASKFQQNMQRHRLSLEGFRYHLALDPSKRMMRPIGIRGIPHVIVLSSDWVVRWQGHPMGLTKETLEQVIEANQALGGGGRPRCTRWADARGS